MDMGLFSFVKPRVDLDLENNNYVIVTMRTLIFLNYFFLLRDKHTKI